MRRHLPAASLAIIAVALAGHAIEAGASPLDGAPWLLTTKLTADRGPDVRIGELTDRPIVRLGHDDWFGQAIALAGETLAVGAPRADNRPVSEAGEVFLYSGSGGTWSGAGRLSAGVAGDGFGWSVALDETRLVVGAPAWRAGTPAVHVYVRSADGWALEETLTGTVGSCFGAAVAVDGATLVVGAPCGAAPGAFVFERAADGGWSEAAWLVSPSPSWRFGAAVAVGGDTIVVGAEAGAAQVFERSANGWEHAATLAAPASGSVALAGETVAVGARRAEEVHVFARAHDAGWTPVAMLTPPPDALSERPGFGAAVGLSRAGDLLAVGALRDDPSPAGTPAVSGLPSQLGQVGRQTGALHVFALRDGTWVHSAKLVAADARSEWWSGESFGASVAVGAAGDVVFGGAPRDACCYDPLNLGFVPAPAEPPCSMSTFACAYRAEEPDAVYAFVRAVGEV